MKANITKFSYEENGFKIEIVRGHILGVDGVVGMELLDCLRRYNFGCAIFIFLTSCRTT
jgi:hypothetical protein